MSAAHTPGPWRVDSDPEGIVRGVVADDCMVCAMIGWDVEYEDEEKANARLMASAPDLLEALQGLATGDFGAGGWTDAMEAYAQKARAAITKATGGKA